MNWLVRTIKRLAIWTGIFFAGAFALVVVVAWMTPKIDEINRRKQEEKQAARQLKQQEWEDGWQKWWDEHQTVDNGGKQPSNKGKKTEPAPGWKEGFTAGYTSGFAAASGGAVKPSSAELDALARREATSSNIAPNEREAWKIGFSAGWGFGWSKGK